MLHLLHLVYKLLATMKVRAYFNSKKNSRSRRPHTTTITIQQPVVPPTQQQIACHTLMEESQINTHHKYQEHSAEPDDFLRVTPRPNVKGLYNDRRNEVKTIQVCQNNKIQNIQNINQSSSKKLSTMGKLLSKKSMLPQYPLECKQKQISQIRNINAKPNINSSTAFIGKQVLCLTQYIISEPHCELFSYDNPRKVERSKYLRVLNQMKKRTVGKNNNDSIHSMNNERYSKRMCKSMVFAGTGLEEQPMNRARNATNRELDSLEKIQLRNNRRLTKQTRNYSLRSSKTNFMGDASYTNRLV